MLTCNKTLFISWGRKMIHKKSFLLFVFFFSFLASSLGQEIRKYDILIIKRNNSRLEGKVLVKGDQVIFISKDNSSRLTFHKDEVTILPANTPKDVYLQKSKTLNMADSKGRLELAQFCFKYDLMEEAEIELGRVIASDSKCKEAYQMLSSLYFQKRKKYREQPREKQNPKDYQALVNGELALYLLAEKNKVEDPLLLYRVAEIYQYLEIPTSALKNLQRAFELAGQTPPPEFKLEGPVLQAEIYLGLHQWEKALEILSKIEDPKDIPLFLKYRLLITRGQGNFYLGKMDDAVKFYEEAKTLVHAKELQYMKVEPALNLGCLYFLKGGDSLINAEENFRDVLELLGTENLFKRVMVLANLSLIYTIQGKFKSSEKYLKDGQELYKKIKAETLVKKDSSLLIAEAYLSLARGKGREACELYEKAAEIEGGTGFLFYLAGKNYMEIGQHEKGERCFQKAIKAGFGAVDCLFDLASIAQKKGKTEKAIRYWRYITENIDSVKFFSGYTKADAFYNLGRSYVEQKNLNQAVKAFKKALTFEGNHIHALNGLGYVYYNQARQLPPAKQVFLLNQARQKLQQVISLDPQNQYAHQILSRISSATTLKMWEDPFQRPNSPRPYNQWNTKAKGGIDIHIFGKKLVFEGEQITPNEMTSAFRTLEAKGFVKFEVTLNVKKALEGATPEEAIEVGILVEGFRTDSQGKVRIYASPKGLFFHLEQPGVGGLVDPERIGDVPANGELVLFFTIVDEKKALVQVGVGNSFIKEMQAPSLMRAETFNLEIYGKAPEKKKWSLSVSRVRIFKRR